MKNFKAFILETLTAEKHKDPYAWLAVPGSATKTKSFHHHADTVADDQDLHKLVSAHHNLVFRGLSYRILATPHLKIEQKAEAIAETQELLNDHHDELFQILQKHKQERSTTKSPLSIHDAIDVLYDHGFKSKESTDSFGYESHRDNIITGLATTGHKDLFKFVHQQLQTKPKQKSSLFRWFKGSEIAMDQPTSKTDFDSLEEYVFHAYKSHLSGSIPTRSNMEH